MLATRSMERLASIAMAGELKAHHKIRPVTDAVKDTRSIFLKDLSPYLSPKTTTPQVPATTQRLSIALEYCLSAKEAKPVIAASKPHINQDTSLGLDFLLYTSLIYGSALITAKMLLITMKAVFT